MLIGAYRANEVTSAHPLTQKLEAIEAAGGKVVEITLAPLAPEHLQQLISEALRCEAERAAPLAQLVHEKTGGNPFFANQFIASLAEEGMLTFDHDAARWSWDLDRIRAKGYTDNLVDLMVGEADPPDRRNTEGSPAAGVSRKWRRSRHAVPGLRHDRDGDSLAAGRGGSR